MSSRIQWFPGSEQNPGSSYPQFLVVNNRPVLAFDAAADETTYLAGVAPAGLTGQLDLVLYLIMASATTGSVRFEALVEAVTPGDSTDLDAGDSFDTTNSAGVAVAGTAGFLFSLTITLTNKDSIAAGDYFRILLRRDADGTTGTDDAAGDCYLLGAELKDAA